jgi:DNA-directed RNA polymerase beta' subunit
VRHLFEIRHDIEKRYKEGDDWVYAKGKKVEIELIKELYEKCVELDKKVFDLREELAVFDPWDAYKSAEYELERVRIAYSKVGRHVSRYDDARVAWEQAQEVLTQSEAYLQKIKQKIEHGEGTEDESKDQTDS